MAFILSRSYHIKSHFTMRPFMSLFTTLSSPLTTGLLSLSPALASFFLFLYQLPLLIDFRLECELSLVFI
jgi:hypothetical protein